MIASAHSFCRYASVLVVLLCSFVLTDQVSAEVITYAFSGKVTTVTPPLPLYGANASPGDPVSGYFTYDTSVPDSDPGSSPAGNYGDYVQSIPNGIAFVVDGVVFSISNYTTHVFNDNGGADTFYSSHTGGVDLVSANGSPTSDLGIGFNFNDTTQSVFSGDAQPTSLSLASFTSAIGTIRDFVADGNGNAEIAFTIDSLSVVPEPSSLMLASVGLIGMVGFAIRRHRNKSR